MKNKINAFAVAAIAAGVLASCGENKPATQAATTFCTDSACLTEPLKTTAAANAKVYVNVSFKDCKVDSIIWEKNGQGKKTINFAEFINGSIRPTRQAFAVDMPNDQYAWVRFNDCTTGRGYIIKLPFEKNGTAGKYTSAINGFDPAFKVADGLVAYYDNTFIYVQDELTGKIAKVLITDTGVPNADFSDVHSLIKTAAITKDHITAKINYEGKESEINKALEFKDAGK